MRRLTFFKISVPFVLFVLFSVPLAAGLITVLLTDQPNSTDITPVSGTTGKTLHVNIGTDVSLPNASRYYGITGISILEKKNNPCKVQIFGGPLDSNSGPDDRLLGQAELDGCGSSIFTWLDYKSAIFRDRPDRFLRAASVCDSKNKKNHKIKGLSIKPAHVEADGSVSPEERDGLIFHGGGPGAITSDGFFSRPNCGLFDESATCDKDQIATGVVMHHTDGSFVGMQLKCRKVKSGATRGLVKDDIGF